MKYLARVGALLLSISLVACASATKRGGGDPVDLALSTSSDDLAPPPRTSERDFSFFEPDFATLAPTTDLAGADLATPPDMTPPRDMATPADMVAVGDMSGGGLPANAGDTCANAPLLPTGVDVTNQDTTPLTDDYDFGKMSSTACAAAYGGLGYDGRDGAYRVVIPAGKTLTVVLTKSNLPTTWDPALGLVTDCASAGPTCLAGSDNVTGLTETVSYKNNGAAPLTVYILVDSFLPSEYGKYSIRADLM